MLPNNILFIIYYITFRYIKYTIIKSIKQRLFTLDDEAKVIPGHGQNTRIYDEKRLNPFTS